MSRGSPTQEQLALLLQELQRSSDYSVLFNQMIAARCGIHPTDLKVLGLLSREGAISAGRIADLTGLTTGAVTFMIDRLEKAGYARRVRHPTDRRSVLIELNREAQGELAHHFVPMDEAMQRVLAPYSEAELALILDFMKRSNDAVEQVITQARDKP